MSPENFCYWLQGLLELSETEMLTKKQVKMIQRHLALVFTNATADDTWQDPNDAKVLLEHMSEASPDAKSDPEPSADPKSIKKSPLHGLEGAFKPISDEEWVKVKKQVEEKQKTRRSQELVDWYRNRSGRICSHGQVYC